MKKIILIFFYLAMHFFTDAQANDTLIIKFRSVGINNDKKLTLQSDFKNISDITIPSRSDFYYLKKEAFNGTDSISLEVNKKTS